MTPTQRRLQIFFWAEYIPATYPHVQHYVRDLLVHDRQIFSTSPSTTYIVAVGAFGSHTYPLDFFENLPDWERRSITENRAIYQVCPARETIDQIH